MIISCGRGLYSEIERLAISFVYFRECAVWTNRDCMLYVMCISLSTF